MKIAYNVSAMVANAALNRNDNLLSGSLEKLSSGYKINHAKDNASGLAMAKRMNAQLRSLEVASQNANDGISVIEIAEGALVEIEEMLQRMNELAVKASNGTMLDDDREMIQGEIDNLSKEIERVADTTVYNGQVLLDGTFDLRGYTDDLNVKIESYSDDVRAGQYVIDSLSVTLDANGDIDTYSITTGANFPTAPDIEIDKNILSIKDGATNFSMELKIAGDVNASPLNVDVTGLGSLKMQVGANEGQELDVRIPKISLSAIGIDRQHYSVTTQTEATKFLGQMGHAIDYINTTRSRLGAYENRLEHTVKSLDVTQENMTGAYSRIMDVDMAREMSEYSKNQVLVQAGTAMLAQANQRPAEVLQLLQQ